MRFGERVAVEAEQGRLDFLPEQVGAFWSGQRGRAVLLDVVAASRRDQRLFIGEAKWGDKAVAHAVLVDLIKRSQLMPQVEAGWQTSYALFSRVGFMEGHGLPPKTRLFVRSPWKSLSTR